MDRQTAPCDAMLAARLAATDPAGLGGLLIRGAGAAIVAFVERAFGDRPVRRIPVSIEPSHLDGALDVAATLATGRRVVLPGLLQKARGGVVVVPMAERLAPAVVSRLSRLLDGDDDCPSIVIACDEGTEDDPDPPAALTDRLAFHVDLRAVRSMALGDQPLGATDSAQLQDAEPILSDEHLTALAATAERFGLGSARILLQAAAAARASARLGGRRLVSPEDCHAAARLVLGPRARRLPADPDEMPPPEPPGPDEATAEDVSPDRTIEDRPLEDRLVAAATATLPADLLASLTPTGPRRGAGDGRTGQERTRKTGRGRPVASRPGRPGGGVRLDLVETLRVAAGAQRLRAPPPEGCLIAIRPSDLRIRRCRRPVQSSTVFVVDASGSAAMRRLGEAKGAVELILADCYVRRDRVAMLAFRGRRADLVLPPTAALTSARRRLADLVGGGGTPLATAIDSAALLAERLRRNGDSVTLVFLTDGQANVARDGSGGRGPAEADALAAAALLKAAGHASLLIDIADRPHERSRRLAEALGATHLPLPRADARTVAHAARAAGGRRTARF